MIRRHSASVFWFIVSTVVILDQATKAVVRVLWSSPEAAHPFDMLVGRLMGPRYSTLESIPVLGGLLRLTFVQNAGAAFGLLPGQRPIFLATTGLVLIAIAGYWRKVHPREWPVVIGSSLIASGALGNLIDRALFGHVTDFFDIAAIDFPVFNVADMAIVGGVGIVIAWLLFGPQEDTKPEHPETDDSGAAEFDL